MNGGVALQGLSLGSHRARIAVGALFLLLLALPPSAAQIPSELASQALAIVVICPDTLLEPDYAGQDEVSCELQDVSRDAVYLPGATSGTSASQHSVTLTTRPRAGSENVTGYQVLATRSTVPMYGGDVIPFEVNVKATPQVSAQDYNFELVAEYVGPGNHNQTVVIPFSAQVNPYDFALLSWSGSQAQSAGQDEVVVYSISITNSGVYPDSYRFTLTSSARDLRITTPSNVYIPAGETRVVNFSLLTPHSKLLEMGRSETIGIKVNSMGIGGAGGSGVYSTTAILQIAGPYIPVYWIPLLLVGFVSMGVVIRGARETRSQHKLERGAPRPVALPPRQSVLLAELKRTDPHSFREKQKALDTVYEERREDFRAHRKERAAADRAEAKVAAAEFAAQKKARKAQRKADKKQRAEDRKVAAKDAKLLAKKERALAKTQKILAKKRAKQDKRDAKVAAKQAKIDAKAAAKQAAADAKAARAAAKADKAAKKQKK